MIKDNEHIRTDQAAFFDAFLRARETFMRIDGVEGVGFGHKETGGDFTNDVGITVFVREKKPSESLSPADRIPATIDGYRTDVRVPELAELVACDDQTHYPIITGGIQIESAPRKPIQNPALAEAGTLGCIVKRRGNSDHDNVFLLTCEHVLHSRGAQEKDYMWHPLAPHKGSGTKGESLGAIQDDAISDHVRATVPGATPGTTMTDQFYIDAGIAQINIDSKCFGTTCTKDDIKVDQTLVRLLGDLTDVRSIAADASIVLPIPAPPAPDVIDSAPATTPRVFKVGRTTEKTTGIVRNVLAVALFQPTENDPVQHLRNVIEIDYAPLPADPPVNCKGNRSFVERGDSGSVVVDDTNRVVGMVFLRNRHPIPADPLRFRSFACHILPVLDTFGICIATKGGTSHGSSGALDGSGTTPARTASDEPRGDGTVLLGVDSQPAKAPWSQPAPVTDEQSANMRAFRDALRETAHGRELHDTFRDVRREIGFLIRGCRPVKVVWHRNQGPAFLAYVLKHLVGDAETIPHEIRGVSREVLLRRMGEVLLAHGSHPLCDAIERFGPEILSMVDAKTAHDCLAILRRAESTEGVPA